MSVQLSLFPEMQVRQHYFVNGNVMKANKDNVLDQFFTKAEVAKKLYGKAQEVICKWEGTLEPFTWLEPSAGNGGFYDLFPIDKRIGIDIAPLREEFVHSDYLEYRLPKQRIIVMGNPPFGHRGVTALDFINHSAPAEYVCFILPMFFNSAGKGSIKYRVKGLNLIYSEALPSDSFYSYTTKKNISVKCVFQIWSKNHKVDNKEFSWYNNNRQEPFADILKVATVSLAPKRECGRRWIFDEKANFYISSTFFNKVSIVSSFEEVKYKSGIAIIFLTSNELLRQKIKDVLHNADWRRYATPATNSCYHIGKSNIFQLLKDNLVADYE